MPTRVEIQRPYEAAEVQRFDTWRQARDHLVGVLRTHKDINDRLALSHIQVCDSNPCLYVGVVMQVSSELERGMRALDQLQPGASFDRDITGVAYRLKPEGVQR